MKQFVRTTGRVRSQARYAVAVSALIFALFGFDMFSGGMLRASVRSLTALGAVARGEAGTALSDVFVTRESLEVENRALREELLQRQFDMTAFTAMREENVRLREMAHLAQNMYSGITAPVISDGSSPYGTLLIGVGQSIGIAVGDIVFTPDGFVVGQVSDVQARTALVTELFASGASVHVTFDDEASLMVEGRGGGNGRIQAPRALVINEGAILTAPALGGAPVAVVGSVESDSASAHKDVYVRTPTNLSTVRFVYVKKP